MKQQGSISVAFGACPGVTREVGGGVRKATQAPRALWVLAVLGHMQKPQHYSPSADRLALPRGAEMWNVISFVGIWSCIKILDKIQFWPCGGTTEEDYQTDWNSYQWDVTVFINQPTVKWFPISNWYWGWRQSQGITKVRRLPTLGSINVCTKCHGHPSGSSWVSQTAKNSSAQYSRLASSAIQHSSHGTGQQCMLASCDFLNNYWQYCHTSELTYYGGAATGRATPAVKSSSGGRVTPTGVAEDRDRGRGGRVHSAVGVSLVARFVIKGTR